MSCGRVLTGAAIGGALLLVPTLGACSGGDSEADAARVVEEFADAVAAEDVVALCAVSAVAERPASEDSGAASVCEDVLAPMILENSAEVKAALDEETAPVVTVDGSQGSAELDGVSTPFSMVEVDDEWFVVVG
ncbi:hypothetical protein [Phytoactinopolyspora endophytica]|uniref:hypothetical protein n=1 Tax=Phytoactinopolyspora endophytica TaxID=1642495 RepID=UPI00101C6E1C|nr:hypothetical protein [Phytoactinopolyspora endophytica]